MSCCRTVNGEKLVAAADEEVMGHWYSKQLLTQSHSYTRIDLKERKTLVTVQN